MFPLKNTLSAIKRPHHRMLIGAGRLRAAAAGLIFAAATALPNLAVGQTINTVVGGGEPDGLNASLASLAIGYIGFDPAGHLYVGSNYRIAKVSPENTYISVAGNGASGYTGDDAAASGAALSNPVFCIDASGNIYVADYSNHRIRKITPDGRITTIAGNGVGGNGGDGGAAINAQVSTPTGIVIDANGIIYFISGNTIRKITPNGIISTIARWTTSGFGGDGASALLGAFNEPQGIATDTKGNVYVADLQNNRIRKIDANGILSTVAGNGSAAFSGDGGPATNASLNSPFSVAVDAADNIYIADTGNHLIRRISPDGKISTVAGDGKRGFSGDDSAGVDAKIDSPIYFALNAAGELHFNDGGNGRIRKLARNGTISTVIGSGMPFFVGDGNAAANAFLSFPRHPTIDAMGNLLFVDASNYRVRKVSPNGRISTVAGNGIAGFSGDGGNATEASFKSLSAVITDAAGNLYIADSTANRVRKVTPDGVISTIAGGGNVFNTGEAGLATEAGLNSPYSLAFDAAGNLFIGCSLSIHKVTPDGMISRVTGGAAWGFGGDGGHVSAANITFIAGMAFDARGNLYVADSGNARIRKIAPDGIISTVAGNGTFGYGGDGGPATAATLNRLTGNIVIDKGGNLYFPDEYNHRVRMIKPDGTISTVAGKGEPGFSGDGGDAVGARFRNPSGVAIDANGDLYVSDLFNNRIRKISTRGGANYSDMWWAGSAENGWGMSIQQHASGAQFNALFVYDEAGQPRWYVMPGGSWSDGFTTYTGQLYQPTSSQLNNYQTSAFAIGAPVGLATIRFSANRADLSFTIDGITASKRLVRMQFGGGSNMLDVGDMWWSGIGENGWGINIAQQGGTLFSVWYTYGSDGKSRWFPMLGGSWANNIFSGPLYSTNSSRWLGSVYDPAAFKAEQIGTMSLRFSGPDAAQLNYVFSSGPFAGTNQTKAITRMVY